MCEGKTRRDRVKNKGVLNEYGLNAKVNERYNRTITEAGLVIENE